MPQDVDSLLLGPPAPSAPEAQRLSFTGPHQLGQRRFGGYRQGPDITPGRQRPVSRLWLMQNVAAGQSLPVCRFTALLTDKNFNFLVQAAVLAAATNWNIGAENRDALIYRVRWPGR